MKFNMSKFEEHLKKDSLCESIKQQNPGMAIVIKEVWNHAKVSSIDFDSFTYEDVLAAHNEMSEIEAYSEDEDGEEFVCDPENGFIVYHNIENLIYSLHHIQGRVYEQTDEEMFI